MTSVPILHTDRCTLSAITQSDISVLCQILDDAETQRFLPELCDEFQTEESLRQFISSFEKYLLQNEGILWGIRKDNTLIGFIAIMDIITNPTLFYAMHPKHRNNGYMKECLVKVVDYVQEVNHCDRLQTEVYNENVASGKLLTDIGFQKYNDDEQKEYYGKAI